MNIDYEKMWKELIDEAQLGGKLEHEKTLKEIMEEYKLTEAKARTLVAKLIREKKLVARKVASGHPIYYSPAIKDIAQ